jgi:hypothetical protein
MICGDFDRPAVPVCGQLAAVATACRPKDEDTQTKDAKEGTKDDEDT